MGPGRQAPEPAAAAPPSTTSCSGSGNARSGSGSQRSSSIALESASASSSRTVGSPFQNRSPSISFGPPCGGCRALARRRSVARHVPGSDPGATHLRSIERLAQRQLPARLDPLGDRMGQPLEPGLALGRPSAARGEAGGNREAVQPVLIAEKRITVTVSSSVDLAVVELAQEVRHLLGAADLRVVVLDLARRELARGASPRPCRSRRRRRAGAGRSGRRRAPRRSSPSGTSATCRRAGSSRSCGATGAGPRRSASRS